jgi:hypothetical protein
MANYESSFNPALPKPIKWGTRPNQYDTDGKAPRSLSLFVPCESIQAFAQYLINLGDDQSKIKTGRVWDYQTKGEVEVRGVYITAKGREGSDGEFGTINPPANSPAELPF